MNTYWGTINVYQANGFYFIKSDKVFIYPSAYRDPAIDIKARLNLEENFVKHAGQAGKNYIVSWANESSSADAVLTCFLGGYLFTIKLPKTYFEDSDDPKFITIKLIPKQLATDGTNSQETDVLSNLSTNAIPPNTTTDIDNYCVCVGFATTETGGCIALDLASAYSTYSLDATRILGKATDTARSVIQNLVDVNNTSISNLILDTNDTTTTTDDIYVINIIIGDYTFAFGNELESNKNYSILLGTNLINNTSDEKVVIGQYNEDTGTNIFEIGQGTDSTPLNIFEVNKSGDATVYHTLTVSTGDLDVNAGQSYFGSNVIVEQDNLKVNQGKIELYTGDSGTSYNTTFEYNTTNKCLEIKVK